LLYSLSVLVKELLSSHFFNIVSDHRVDRVLSFFSSRRNWDSPTPLTRRLVSPPPFGSGEGAHSLAREGLGESQFRRGYLHCGTLYLLYTFFLDITMTILYNIPTVNKDDRSTPSLQIITLWAKLTATVMSLLCTEQKEIKMSLSLLCHCQVKASSS